MPYPTSFDVSSSDHGMPFTLPGKGIRLVVKNRGTLGFLTVKSGELINSNLPYNQSDQDEGSLHLPFYMFSVDQDYSNTVNSQYKDWNLFTYASNVASLNIDVQTYVYNSSFTHKFNLSAHELSGEELVFYVYFFPYYLGEYSAELKVMWNDNVSYGDKEYTLNFTGSMLGRVSEIDQTEYPEVVFEVDQTYGGNFFEIEG